MLQLVVDPDFARAHPYEAARDQVRALVRKARERRMILASEAARRLGAPEQLITEAAEEGMIDSCYRLEPAGRPGLSPRRRLCVLPDEVRVLIALSREERMALRKERTSIAEIVHGPNPWFLDLEWAAEGGSEYLPRGRLRLGRTEWGGTEL